uniref:Uncharacterized protein n=1 Tax=Arundo donax TaxID=35708 RepID=A0A0A9BRD9_ARUDO
MRPLAGAHHAPSSVSR